MKQTIFYSWQSDLPNATNRGFIGDCLERAVKELEAEGTLEVEPCVDRDTLGLSGSPDIVHSIFDKIDAAAMFVCDVSFINGARDQEAQDCKCTRPTINPNVAIELGRAMKCPGIERVACVFNEATGSMSDLPFDLRNRRIIKYCLRPGEDKADQRKALVSQLKAAIQDVMKIPHATLQVEFADLSMKQPAGRRLELKGMLIDVPNVEAIPDYPCKKTRSVVFQGRSHEFTLSAPAVIPFGPRVNPDYLREKVTYLAGTRLMQPISFVISNDGDKSAHHVSLELTVSQPGVLLLNQENKTRWSRLPDRHIRADIIHSHLQNIRHLVVGNREWEPTVEKLGERTLVAIGFERIRPAEKAWSGVVYVGSIFAQTITMSGRVLADNLPPQEVLLHIDFDTEVKSVTWEELEERLPEECQSKET